VSGFPGYSAADQAQYLMAEAYGQLKDDASARAALDQFMQFFPTSPLRPTVRFHIGLADFGAKNYAGAALAFTDVLADSAPPDVRGPARYNLALCLRMLGEPDSARVELNRYRAERGDDARAAEIAYQLGDLNETQGKTKEALEEFEHALAAKPSAALAVELHFRAGRCHEQLGETTAALREYEVATAAPGRYDDAFRLSALARSAALYESRKEITRALVAYRDIMRNAKDHELVAAATTRVSELEAGSRKR
jgi:TolA-binding protein